MVHNNLFSFKLFDMVSLIKDIGTEGEDVPAGTEGTIVMVLGDGAAYIVEFFHAHQCVVTVPHDFLSHIW